MWGEALPLLRMIGLSLFSPYKSRLVFLCILHLQMNLNKQIMVLMGRLIKKQVNNSST